MKIICIGQNYLKHIHELGHAVPTEPVFFMKPETALLRDNEPFYVPDFSEEVHYECELVVRINRMVKGIEQQFAHRCYDELGLGIDFTARDVQRRCSAAGLPWEIAKAFDSSAAVSNRFIPVNELPPVQNLHFSLRLNDQTVQNGDTSDMLFSVDRVISYVSRFVTLKTGDLLFTGTPAGVGAVHPGDRLRGELEGNVLFDFGIK